MNLQREINTVTSLLFDKRHDNEMQWNSSWGAKERCKELIECVNKIIGDIEANKPGAPPRAKRSAWLVYRHLLHAFAEAL